MTDENKTARAMRHNTPPTGPNDLASMGYKAGTPGPWQVISGSVYTADEIPIAYMVRNTPRTLPTERDANARLIAAAPELLAAARKMVAYIDGNWPGKRAERLPVQELRAAIAKAEGN